MAHHQNALKVIAITSIAVLLSSCQAVNQSLQEVNNGLSKITRGSVARNSSPSSSSTKEIKNKWNVNKTEAMAWLSQNEPTWNDHGKLKKVNWYTFWSQQIHYQTALASKAHQYCHKDSWDTQETGANCQTYFQAYTMTKSEESHAWDQKVQNDS